MGRFGTMPRQLILASRSPRRRELLEDAGFDFAGVGAGVDDSALVWPGSRVSAGAWTAALAWLKGWAGLESAEREGLAGGDRRVLVLAADTVVEHAGEVLGQPRDVGEARRMLERLIGSEHRVITGVALLASDGDGTHGLVREGVRLLIDRSRVAIHGSALETLGSYLESGGWRGKAGGYNLSERLASGWRIEFDGDPTSIMGLPMGRLGGLLRAMLGGDGVCEARGETAGVV